MHRLYDALLMPYVRSSSGDMSCFARTSGHRYIHNYLPPRSRTAQQRRTLIPLSVSERNDLVGNLFDSVELMDFKRGPMFFYWRNLLASFFT